MNLENSPDPVQAVLEKRIVLSLSRFPLELEDRQSVRQMLESEVDWQEVLALARDWQLEPMAFSNLRSHFRETIPPRLVEEISARERDARAFAIARTLTVVELCKRMEEAGIRVLVLKGPAIGIAGYGDPSMRQFGDIDLLVRREDVGMARNLLLAIGFSRDYPPHAEADLLRAQHALEFVRGSNKVEIHFSLFSQHLRLNFNLEEIWEQSVTMHCVGADIRGLSAHHLFLFVCAHGAKHEWLGMRWICDVAQLGDRLRSHDIEAVLSTAVRTNSVRLLALATDLVREVFGRPVAGFEGRLEVQSREAKVLIVSVTYRLGLASKPKNSMFDVLARLDERLGPLFFWTRARERWRDRILCFGSILFVPTSKDSRWKYIGWIVRPARLVATAARRLKAA